MRVGIYFHEIRLSFVFKAVAVAASFMLVPVMLGYAGAERFGIWVTLYSVLSWITYFDLGLASALRNRIAEYAAKSCWNEARVAVSSAYFAIGGVVLAAYALFALGSFWIDWRRVFHARTVPNEEIWGCMLVFAFLFLSNFLLGSVNQLLYATHQASRVVQGQMFTVLLALGGVYILQEFAQPSLILLAVFYGGAQLLSFIGLNVFFFHKKPMLTPMWSAISKTEIAGLMSGGWGFFVIQLAVLAIFTTDKMVMTQLYSPEVVAGYEVVNKLFSAVMITASLLMAPLWSSYTHLWAQNDILAMRRLLQKSNLILLVIVIPALLIFWLGDRLIKLWVGESLYIPQDLYLAVFSFVLLRVWCDIYAFFLNGSGAIKVQMWLAVLQCLLNVPLAVWLGHLYGPSGVIWASFITLSLSAIVLPIHVFMIIKEKKIV